MSEECNDNLAGWEYFWESGDFVLVQVRPHLEFPSGCNIFDMRLGTFAIPDGLVKVADRSLRDLNELLVTCMKRHGVPCVNDISHAEGDGMKLVRDKLAGTISREEFEVRKKEIEMRDHQILVKRREQHLARHPEQI